MFEYRALVDEDDFQKLNVLAREGWRVKSIRWCDGEESGPNLMLLERDVPAEVSAPEQSGNLNAKGGHVGE